MKIEDISDAEVLRKRDRLKKEGIIKDDNDIMINEEAYKHAINLLYMKHFKDE